MSSACCAWCAFAPVLAKNGGGAVANMLSVVSWFTNPLNATYCASKHAALALTEGVRIQLRSQGTQVVAVFAGFIDTDMAAAFDRVKTSPRQVAERTLAGIREGLDEVHADERSEAVWLVVRTDPARFSAQREVRVGGARPHLLTKLSRMPARPTPAAWSSSNGHPATISANPDSSGYAMKRTRDLSDEYRPHPDALLHLVGGETVARAAICGRET